MFDYAVDTAEQLFRDELEEFKAVKMLGMTANQTASSRALQLIIRQTESTFVRKFKEFAVDFENALVSLDDFHTSLVCASACEKDIEDRCIMMNMLVEMMNKMKDFADLMYISSPTPSIMEESKKRFDQASDLRYESMRALDNLEFKMEMFDQNDFLAPNEWMMGQLHVGTW